MAESDVSNRLPAISIAETSGGSCFDSALPVTAEERRIADGAPIPHQILEDSRFDRFVTAFERDLCSANNLTDAEKTVKKHAALLWRTAVDRSQGRRPDLGDLDPYDDRPLYWARLHMTRALRRWAPDFPIKDSDRLNLLKKLEYDSRGISTVDFPEGRNIKRILVSGFDPYRLEQEIRRSNPSGSAALQLHGLRVDTEDGLAVIQAVIFPVRWRDFEDGIVEDAFAPFLKPGPKRIDLMMTISQGRKRQMAIEGYAGRWHTGTDNNLESRSGVIPTVSRWPMPDPLPEFIETTLPVDAMVEAGTGPWPVFRNNRVGEWQPPDFVECAFHERGPTPGSKARAGSGGDYLSNESQYRSNRVRLGLGAVDIPGGHLHVAALEFYPEDRLAYIDPAFQRHRKAIVDQTVNLVKAAARALK
ncbi:MAG: hypothetical protein AB2404_02405 [Planifilum fimeticola]